MSPIVRPAPRSIAANPRRAIPAVSRILLALEPQELPRPVVLAEVRRTLAALRRERDAGDFAAALGHVRAALAAVRRSRLAAVINATGVILHTNLGRAPLGAPALAALAEVAENYTNLEFDLDARTRGGRAPYLERTLALLCRSEAATVVNNCAAALVLVLRGLTRPRPEVILSRGELVQIGGGFRIPEILEASGARLREVGTTNRTSIEDYARAVGPDTALILKVHRSNFRMDGFVASPSTRDIAALARAKKLPFVEDLGSGAVHATESIAGLNHEPTPAEVLGQGADLVTFSGDKLLGGPQAGIVAGRSALVAALKRDPFFRALRCDKLVFAALQATVDSHLAGTSASDVPVESMLRASVDGLRQRAGRIIAALDGAPMAAEIGTGATEVGGGSLPGSQLASVRIELRPRALGLTRFAARLAAGSPPVIGSTAHGCLRIDLRTVFPRQDQALVGAIRQALGHD